MNTDNIKNKISPILKKYGVKRAGVFGSFSRGEDTPQSDVDILISIGKPMGMFAYMQMKREIEFVLEKKIDIVTEKSINKFIRPYIIKEVKQIYEE